MTRGTQFKVAGLLTFVLCLLTLLALAAIDDGTDIKVASYWVFVISGVLGPIAWLLYVFGENIQKQWAKEDVRPTGPLQDYIAVAKRKRNDAAEIADIVANRTCIGCKNTFQDPPDEAYGTTYFGNYLRSGISSSNLTHTYSLQGSARGLVCNDCVNSERKMSAAVAVAMMVCSLLLLGASLALKVSVLVMFFLVVCAALLIFFFGELAQGDHEVRDEIVKSEKGGSWTRKEYDKLEK